MSSERDEYSEIIPPLRGYFSSTKQVKPLIEFIRQRADEFLEHDEAHEAFYASYAALAINNLVPNANEATGNRDLEPVLKCLLKFLLSRCSGAKAKAVLSCSQVVGLIRTLCTGQMGVALTNPQFEATLKIAASLPPHIAKLFADVDLSSVDDDESKAANEVAADDLLTSLSTYAEEAEFKSKELVEMMKQQQLTDMASRLFVETLNGQSILWDYLSSLEYLQRYADAVQQLQAGGGGMTTPTSEQVAAFKSSSAALHTQMSVVYKAVCIPAMFTTSNEDIIKKMVSTTLTSVYAGSYAILCAARNPSTDFQNVAYSVVKRAVDILNAVSKGMKECSRISTHIHTNMLTLVSWLIFTTLHTLNHMTEADVQPNRQQSDSEPGNCWSLSSHCYASEALNCLQQIATDASPGQVPSKPITASRSSTRLHDAQKFSVAQFNIQQAYTYLELVKFLCSGSSLRLSGVVFSTITSLMNKYSAILAKAKSLKEEEERAAEAEADILNDTVTVSGDQPAIVAMVSSGDDNSMDSLSGVHEMFSDEDLEMLYDDLDAEEPPPSSPVDNNNVWVTLATNYVAFIDKHMLPAAVLKDYLYGELCQTRSQQSLSLLATVVKSTSEPIDELAYHSFSMAIRRLVRHMIQKGVLDHSAQENLLLMINLFPDNLVNWPIYAHRNMLSIFMDIMLHWKTSSTWEKDQVVVVDMWKHFLGSILSECLTANYDGNEIEDVNIEHCQVMLTLLYSLSDNSKKQVFAYLAKTLINAVDIERGQLVSMVPLPVTRLCLLLEYMLCHLSTAPSQLREHVKDNVMGEEIKQTNFIAEGNLEHVYRKHTGIEAQISSDTSDARRSKKHKFARRQPPRHLFPDMLGRTTKSRQPKFYRLAPNAAKDGRDGLDPLAIEVLMFGDNYDLELSDFYKHCLTAMLVGSSLDKQIKKGKMTALGSCAVHYHIKVIWRLLGLLPPPPAFLLQMTDVSTLGAQVAALQAIRLSPRMRNPAYIQLYKETLKGTLEEAEIEGLVDSVLAKTKSPMFQVDITLHILQAQMSTLTFASQGEVVDAANLPDFHTILVLDAVLSQTHALMDMHYQELQESSSAESEYEEAKQLGFKHAADSLLPALLLMLGSFTEFVRSSLLHQVSDSGKHKSALATLLSLSSAPDDYFKVFIMEPTEMAKVLKEWRNYTFYPYPTLGNWKGLSDEENPSEAFTNAVIHGHCSTLSDCGAEWSTVLPLRHLQMTLIKITADLCSWFPSVDSGEELCRTLVPLLFDGSVTATSAGHVTSCLNQVIGHSKLKEEKHTYAMRRWHATMLSLHELSDSLSSETCRQMVEMFSFFFHSCLEEQPQWLANFYTNKADLADLLLVTGMPGCADIVSINRILKIFASLISMADSKTDSTYPKLLKSLNKLATIREAVLCEWLQKIIMASPGEPSSTDVESQIDKNALLLHTIAAYMVKDNSLIDRTVPKAILQSLTTVATGVLHETHNAQGFQELMLIMSTLAKSGEVMSLFTAIIKWLETCLPYLSTSADPDKHSLYVELSSCLLFYINDVLGVLKGRPADGKAQADELSAEDEDDDSAEKGAAAAPDTSALDNQLCTFVATQRDFKQQHWYHCYTCNMVDGIGVCSICVKVCHKDHDVSYAKNGSFFCDCGERGEKFCQALKKRTGVGMKQGQAATAEPSSGTSGKQSKISMLRQRVSLASLIKHSKEQVLSLVDKGGLLHVITKLLSALEPEYIDRYETAMPQQAAKKAKDLLHDLHTTDKMCASSDKLMLPQMSSPEGTFDNVKPSFSGDQGTTIKQLINSHMIRRQIVCKMTTSGGKEPMLAVANDKGKITILQIASLFKSDEGKTRLTLTRSHTPAVPFSILSMSTNPSDEDLIAVCGLKECHVLSLSRSGAVAKCTILHPALETGNFIVKAQWLPGNASGLAIVTADFIKIYYLHADVISPAYFYLLPAGKVRDVTFCLDPSTGQTTILVMSSSGSVYSQQLDNESKALHGPFYITNAMELPHPDMSSVAGRVVLGGGASIYYSHPLKLLMLSFIQGQTFSSTLDSRTITVSNIVKISLAKGKGNNTQPMVQWSESYGHPGLLFCITQSTNNPLALYFTPESVTIQEIKPSTMSKSGSNGKASKALDYVAVRSPTSSQKSVTNIMLICEDGSLRILTANDPLVGLWTRPSLNPCSPFDCQKVHTKKKTSSKKGMMASVQMPVDFFESCSVTNEIEYGGNDLLEVYHRALIKQRLSTGSQYVACTKPDSFKIEVINSSTSHVIVGVRILVGGHLISRLPSYIEIFGKRRPVHPDRDGPRWMDIAFSREDAIRGFSKFVITVGSSTHSDHVTFIDSIKCYSKSKDAFGWSEEEASQVNAQTNSPQTASTHKSAATQQTGSDEQDGDDGAEGQEGEEMCGSPQMATPLDRLLSSALHALSLYCSASPKVSQPATGDIERSVSKLVLLLPPTCVQQGVNNLLQALTTDHNIVHDTTDKMRVECIDKWMSLSVEELNPCTYQLVLQWVRQLGKGRPSNLHLLAKCYADTGNYEKKFLTGLVERFGHLYANKPYHKLLAPACFPGLQNTRATVHALVDIIFMVAGDRKDLLPCAVALCMQLLFHKDTNVRFAGKQAMVKVLKPKSKGSKAKTAAAPEAAEVKVIKESKPVQATEDPAPVAAAPAAALPHQMMPPGMQLPPELLPPGEMDLQDWLAPNQLEPNLMEDLEFAIALSLQDRDGDGEDDDEPDDDDDDDDDDEEEAFQMVEPNVHQADIMIVGDGDEFDDPLPTPATAAPDEPEPPAAPSADVDSDGGQLSAHSSTEAVQNVGLSAGQRSDSTSTMATSADAESDHQQKKLLRSLVRREMMTNGVANLENCNGVNAIPFLQVMLMLLSDLDTAEDITELDYCLTVLLERLVNFKQSWAEFMKRTDRAELELIVLRLFSVLMSRSHQYDVSSSKSGSKITVCAATVLIRANCLDFFLPLLKQLLQFWKTYNPEGDSSSQQKFTGSTANTHDMSPFFLRQYVKEHPLDVFEVFPQLQTEMVLRLINQMKKISDNNSELTSLTLGDEWTRVLSEYMVVCEAAFIKRQVRKLLTNICRTKENYRRVRDINTITTRMTAVKDSALDCGVTENLAGADRTIAIPYTTLTTMVENLKVVQEIATSRTINWQKYCAITPGTIELMLLLCVQTTQGLADSLITLLSSAVKAPSTGSKSSDSGAVTTEDLNLHKQIITEIMSGVRKDLLSEFFRVYLLQFNQTPIRTLMHAMVLSVFEQGDGSQKLALLNMLWAFWPQLSHYGDKANKFVDLLGHMIIQADLPNETKRKFVVGVIDLLSSSNNQLKHHQNTNIYNMLQELVDMDGYYLEREPCMTCNDPETTYAVLKLNNIKVDNKFTTTTQMIKLTQSYMISRIYVRITDIKKSKMVKTITINYSTRTVQSAVELKNRVGIWQFAKKVHLTANQSDIKIDFTVPIIACNLMIEYSDFYENNQAVQESLPCPRCSASVPANPGICVNCGENVFQCHKCRSINYDEKDPFLCNTCGFCKYGKFDLNLTARAWSAVEPIDTEEDRTKTLSSVNSMLEKADRTYSEIQSTRSHLERLIMQLSGTKTGVIASGSSSSAGHVNKFIQQVAVKYCDESRKHFEDLSKSMQKVVMSRRELLEFDRKSSQQVADTPSSASVSSQTYITDQLRAEAERNEDKIVSKLKMAQRSSSGCYGCLTATVKHCITLLHALTTQPFTTSGSRLIKELVSHNLNSGPMDLRRDAMLLLCTLTKNNAEATRLLYSKLYDRIMEAMEFCTSAASLAMNIRSEMMVISLSVDSDVSLWEERMKTVIRLYSAALQTHKSHVIEAVALSCLEIIKGQIITGRPSSHKRMGQTLQEIAGLRVGGNRPAVDVARWLHGARGHSFVEWRDRAARVQEEPAPSVSEGAALLQKKYFDRWRLNMQRRQPVLSELSEGSWLSNVLFNPASQTSREMCGEIITKIAEVKERKLLLAASLSKLLSKVPAAGSNATQFIQLYRELIVESETKYYLVIKHDILIYIAGIISSEIEALCTLEETTLGSDLGQGWGLHSLVSIVKSFIDDELIRRKYKSKLVGTVLDGYLSLRKLVVQRTKMIESTQELLLGLLETLTTGTEAETREFMSVCIQTLSKYSPSDLRSPVFIFERLCSIIRPEENNTKEFLMVLEKDPQQEDFLQGRMSGNPYLSKEPGLGPLMRDVKNKICTDCELVALLEDDNGMELLVNNKIISLDLPVADVYRKIWQPNRENDPMRIVYRMRGLLGDATEDMVNSLQANDAEEEDSDTVYRMAAVMQQCAGLDAMLKRLGYIHNYHRGKQLVNVLLKLFDYCLKLKVNRAELIKPEKDTISVMLRALNRALRAEQQGSQGAGNPAVQSQGQSITEKVLQVMETVLSEASRLPPEQYTEFTKRCGDSDQLMLLLDRINSPFVRSNSSVLEALMKLIPFLACGEQEKMSTLLEHFRPYLNFLQFDVKHTDNEVTYLECFCVITSGIKENANGSRLKQMIIDSKILADAIEYLTLLSPAVKTLLATDLKDWKEFVSRPSLPYVLRLLTGLCAGHVPSQEIVGKSMIPILHKLEQMSSHGQIGSLAENLMETLCENKNVSKQIKEIRAKTRAEKKKLAMAKREKQLSSMGMKTNKKGQVLATSSVMKDAEGLKEESGIICSICREGYHNQPNKVIAVYTFTRRVSIEESETRARKSQGLFTVSHMNLVHADCHASAVRLASARDEWESAALHNSNTRCNGLLPLWGPQVTESNFAAALAKHNSYLRDCTELRDDSYTLTVHDIKLLLLRLATEKPFSSDGGGGGRNSNMLLVPYELLLVLYVLNTQRSSKVKEKNLQAFMDTPKSKWVESSYEVDGPIYWLVMSLVLWSRQTWNKNKLRFLKRLLVLAQARKISPSGANSLKDKSVKDYSVYKSMLVLFSLVDSLFNVMFKNVACDKDWVESLMTYIRNNDVSLAEASEKIISSYESELLPCDSLGEMFDILDLLEEIPDPDGWVKNLLLSC